MQHADYHEPVVFRCEQGGFIGRYRLPFKPGPSDYVPEGVEGSEVPVPTQDYEDIATQKNPYSVYQFTCKDGHSPRIRDDELPRLEVQDREGKPTIYLPLS